MGWALLPAEGRKGEPPDWPLLGLSGREEELWRALWARPQATMWESFGQDIEVALYTRNLALVEVPGSPVNLATLLRQQADALGLTIPGLRTNRWKIAGDEVAERRATKPVPATPAKPSARDRFRVVNGPAAG